MPPGWKPCLEHMQRRPGLLVAFSLSLVSFKRVNFQGTWRGFCSLGVVLPGGMNMASCLISTVFKIYRPKMNCRGFFGLLFSYPFGLFIPRVLDT